MTEHPEVPEALDADSTVAARLRPVELYEYESCRYCRRVRLVLADLDLMYLSRPAPRGSRNRAELVARGGMSQVPFLVDPNTGVAMYESADIAAYLRRVYGREEKPAGSITETIAAVVGGLFKRPMVPVDGLLPRDVSGASLVLYADEGTRDTRAVRESLEELELDHLFGNAPGGGRARAEFEALGAGAPCLVDQATNRVFTGVDAILAHLRGGPGARP